MEALPTARDRPSASAQAAEALTLVLVEPHRARALAAAARERARAERDPDTASVAERVLGLVAKELKDLPTATAHLRRAVAIAERASARGRAGEARLSLSLVLAYAGNTRGALKEADRATPAVRGLEAAKLQLQRALILQRLGRTDEAFAGYRSALALFRRYGDLRHQARLLNNRGLLHAYRGSLGAAERDLVRAEALHVEVGQELAAAETRHNLGFVAGRRGDVPAALRWFDDADEHFREHGVPRGIYLLDRCEVLLSVRLVDEARAAAERAVTELERGRMSADLAEARLLSAEAAVLAGDLEVGRIEAERAQRAFSRQRRPGWAALAGYTRLRAVWLSTPATPALLRSARRTADALAAAGWMVPALDARLIAGRVALTLGNEVAARRELSRAAAARRRGLLGLRVRAWHAEALLRERDGNRRAAYAALNAGLRLLDQHRAALGATELRAHTSAQAEELASFGLRLALESGNPTRVLVWAERFRAGSLHLRPIRPPHDTGLAAELASLRRVVGELEGVAAAGGDTRELVRRQAESEERIRRRSRTVSGTTQPALASPISIEVLASQLGDRVLVEYIQSADSLLAVTVSGGRLSLQALGPVEDAAAHLQALRFSLRRLAHGRGAARSLAAASEAASRSARLLDELLLGPLRETIADRPLVVVPTGSLHAVPWAVLPTNTGRPISVSPSATLWSRASSRHARGPSGRGRVLVVAGPDLAGAPLEVAEVATFYPRAERLVGDAADAEAVRTALDGASLAHVAAHGTFRADNPLFSSLRLWDGPLTVYDLETLRSAPETLVLSACDSGLSAVRPGDELMGLAAALFSLGTTTIIGSVIPVPDDATRHLMGQFHRELTSGLSAPAALARAQATVVDARHETVAAAAGFVSLGAG